MKTARGPGEYQPQPLTHPTNSADIPIGYASHLWTTLTLGGIQRRVDDISKQFTGAGWKSLPQELVNEILGYLLGNLPALKACSLTCKRLFGATRPLIHQRLVCLDTRPDPLKQKRYLFSRRRRTRGVFERLVNADRSGILRYTRHLTFEPTDGTLKSLICLMDLQEYLPQLRSIAKLDGLTLDNLYLPHSIPAPNEISGRFVDTLRHLDIRNAFGTEQQLLYLVCWFPRLEDLTIVSPNTQPRTPIQMPTITQSPPLQGKLVLVDALSKDLAALPGGVNFRSLELAWCDPQPVLAACGHTAASVSYLWKPKRSRESNPPIQVWIAM